jgi:hypothetical protein
MKTLLLFSLLVCGCGSVSNYRIVTGVVRVPNTTHDVLFAMENEPPPPTFTEIAIVAANGYGVYSNEADVIEALRTEAAKLGADAVVRVHIDRGNVGAFGTGVAVLLNGGPLRGAARVQSAAPIPVPEAPSTAPAIPPGYEAAVPPPPQPSSIPEPP